MNAVVYILSVLAAAALYATHAVPASPGVMCLQIVAWVGGLTFGHLLARREHRA